MRRKLIVLAVLALGAGLALAGTAHAGNGGFAPVPPASPNAERISQTYKLIALLTGIVFVVVEGSLIWFLVKYRRRGRDRAVEGPQIHGATRLELIWTGVPVVILAVIAAFVFYKLPGIKNVPAAKAQGGPLEINIEAHQFYWQFTYPNGAISIDELHAPVDHVVQVNIHSQDVAHSWWVPALGGKFDAIPGRTTHTWFQALRTGSYRGQCGEFCGVFHAKMSAHVDAQSQADYESFLATARDPMVLGGAQWRGVCAKCHGLDGSGGYGPNIQTNAVLVSPAGLRSLLTKGQNQLGSPAVYMPPVGLGWTDEQFTALETYIKARVYKGSSSGG